MICQLSQLEQQQKSVALIQNNKHNNEMSWCHGPAAEGSVVAGKAAGKITTKLESDLIDH